LIPENPSQIKIDPKTHEITESTLDQLILQLTATSAKNNLDFQKAFLITFPSFATPHYLFAALLTRFFPDLTDSSQHYNITESAIKSLRDRVIRILTFWMKIAPYQFDETLVQTVKHFHEQLKELVLAKVEYKLLPAILEASIKKLEGSLENKTITTVKGNIPNSILPNKPEAEWTIFDISPIELARQITQIHSEIFQRIGPLELLTAIYGAKKGGGAPNIDELTHHFDVFSRFVSFTVIQKDNPHDRGHLYKYWVDVAEEFLNHQNLHGMFAVMSGLTHVSITRMAETMKFAKKTNGARKKVMQQLIELTDFSQNYSNYRKFIETPHHPRILFLGAYQKDLIYVQEQFPNKIDGLINFRKSTKCVELVYRIEDTQNEKFQFHIVPKIRELITNIPNPPESTKLMEMSMQKEKKKK